MSTAADESPGQSHRKRFSSLTRYNTAYPHAALPPSPGERDALRRFDAAGIGVEDDVSGSGALLTIDFLPGGAPDAGALDRVGTVIATHWGQAPVEVLAENVSLRAAWRVVTQAWPRRLSETCEALGGIRRFPPID